MKGIFNMKLKKYNIKKYDDFYLIDQVASNLLEQVHHLYRTHCFVDKRCFDRLETLSVWIHEDRGIIAVEKDNETN